VGWKPTVYDTSVSYTWVEREPMWDGNFLSRRIVQLTRYVEREPMWDGNVDETLSPPATRMVEREPMWDGNMCTSGTQFSLSSLSENQCGMET